MGTWPPGHMAMVSIKIKINPVHFRQITQANDSRFHLVSRPDDRLNVSRMEPGTGNRQRCQGDVDTWTRYRSRSKSTRSTFSRLPGPPPTVPPGRILPREPGELSRIRTGSDAREMWARGHLDTWTHGHDTDQDFTDLRIYGNTELTSPLDFDI